MGVPHEADYPFIEVAPGDDSTEVRFGKWNSL
jgi:hypothetical protein